MSKTYAAFFALVLMMGLSLAMSTPGSAHAQYLDPRLGQAMAVCNSPLGALSTECQQLKAVTALGGVPGVPGVAGIAQGNPAAAAAAQQVYAACVSRAGVNQGAIAACNANLNRTLGLPQPVAGSAAGYNPTNTAMNIATGGAAYQRCVQAMMAQGGQPGGINPCTPLLNGNPAGPGAPAGFGAATPTGGGSLQAQYLASYQACNAQLSLQMRGHECAVLLSGGPAPAGFNQGGASTGGLANNANPPAPGYNPASQGGNPPAPGYNPPAPPPPSRDPLGNGNRPFDPLGL